jgi:sugar phosphate isomerase/epimerase
MEPNPLHRLSRRQFLSVAAVSGLAGSLAPVAHAAGPFTRTGGARLRLSMAAYSLRKYFAVNRGKPNRDVPPDRTIDLFKFIDYCAEHGCLGAELTGYYFSETSNDYLVRLRRHCILRGIGISGTAIGNNFSLPPGTQREAEIALAKQWIDHTAVLGAPFVRVFAGRTEELARDAADKLVISALEECCDYAAGKGVFLGLENHDSIMAADKVIAMVEAVRSPWIGVNLDSANFHTDDPYDDFARCVPYAINVQLKTEIGMNSPGGPRPADLPRLTKILRDGGYQGWVALEYEAAEDPFLALPRHLAELRSLLSTS